MKTRPVKLLVTGGCRSGKSRYALTRFSKCLGHKFFLATAEAGDDEMAERIELHRKERDASWITLEEPVYPAAIISDKGTEASVLVLDCLTLWISNLMMRQVTHDEILQRAQALAQTLVELPCPVAVVTNEVGFGLVPDNALGRDFRDLAGRVNQTFAETFDEVVLMVAGVPLKVKEPHPPQPASGQTDFSGAFPETEKNAVYEAIYLRRDMRHFLPDPLDPEVVGRILDAAHHAGSVGFMQPWNFLVIDDSQVKQRVADNFNQANTAAANKFHGERKALYQSLKLEGLREAPLHICITCDSTRLGPKVLGRDTIPETDLFSTCCAVQNLWLAARAEGLGVGWVSILDPDQLKKDLGIPDHILPVAYLCVGKCEGFYREPMLQSKGWAQRLPLTDLVYYNQWRGQPGNFRIEPPPDSGTVH